MSVLLDMLIAIGITVLAECDKLLENNAHIITLATMANVTIVNLIDKFVQSIAYFAATDPREANTPASREKSTVLDIVSLLPFVLLLVIRGMMIYRLDGRDSLLFATCIM